MPTYEYLCQTCRHRFETWQKMTDEPLTTCPECGSSIRRVLFPAGIVFKGHGFYKTDHSDSKVSTSTNGTNGSHEHNGSNGENGKSENGKSENGKSESNTTTTESKAASPSTESKPSSESKTTTSSGTK